MRPPAQHVCQVLNTGRFGYNVHSTQSVALSLAVLLSMCTVDAVAETQLSAGDVAGQLAHQSAHKSPLLPDL